jgi:thymidylate kinase
MPRAEVNIFLDLDPAVSAQRRPDHRDRYEKDRAKQVAVRANYRKLWGRMQVQEPDDLDDMQYATCWHIVDASPPMDEVFAKVWQIYEEALDTYG